MDHLVVLLGRPVAGLEERPGAVEQVGRELAPGRRVDLGRGGRRGHGGRVLRRELAEDVQDALEPERPGLDPAAVVVEEAPALGRVVGREVVADGLERHLEVAQPDDRPRGLELVAAVEAVAGLWVRPGRPEQVELVVVPQRPDAQPGQPREPPDRQQVWVVHAAIVDPRRYPRVKPWPVLRIVPDIRGPRRVRRCRARGRRRAG